MEGFNEYWTLVACMIIAGFAYVHMAISVMLEIATELKIPILTVPNKKSD